MILYWLYNNGQDGLYTRYSCRPKGRKKKNSKKGSSTNSIKTENECVKPMSETKKTQGNDQAKPVDQANRLEDGGKVKASTISRKELEAAKLKLGLDTKIEEGNKGYDILKKMGYKEGQGLGKNTNGILQPLPLEIKTDRKGLGAEKKAPSKNAENKQVQQKAVIKTQEVCKQQKKSEPSNIVKNGEIQEVAKQKENPKLPSVPEKLANGKAVAQVNTTNNTPTQLNGCIPTKANELKNTPFQTTISKSLLKHYSSDIETMRLRLKAAASRKPIHSDNDMVVAQICIDDNQPITRHVLEFIRTELVGWIGVYQEQEENTPVFHNMSDEGDHIAIVCDNLYAYNCLEDCVDDIAQMKTLGFVTVQRRPLITSLVYYAEAVYEGIADAELFRSQLQMHRPKLNVELWMMVSQETDAMEGTTNFAFLIDERSALVLVYHYSSNFYICMQKLVFRNISAVTDRLIN